MYLSRNFSLSELTKSQTALRNGLDNKPSIEEIVALTVLCNNILQPVREAQPRASMHWVKQQTLR